MSACGDDPMAIDQAESRLRACLIAGSSSTGQNQLEAAVIQARAPVAGQPLRDQELLQWCAQLLKDVLGYE